LWDYSTTVAFMSVYSSKKQVNSLPRAHASLLLKCHLYATATAAAAAVLQDVRLPESSIHDFARDMVVALQFLHANSIIYCDIKPSNILLDENGRLKLGGFGLSRRLSDINKNPVTNLPPVSVWGGVCEHRPAY
jgi:serine/threonine protein kinase